MNHYAETGSFHRKQGTGLAKPVMTESVKRIAIEVPEMVCLHIILAIDGARERRRHLCPIQRLNEPKNKVTVAFGPNQATVAFGPIVAPNSCNRRGNGRFWPYYGPKYLQKKW